MAQGVDWQNDGITDISRMQNSPPIGSNMEVGEDDNFGQEQDHWLSYAEEVMDRLPPEGVKQMAVLLIASVWVGRRHGSISCLLEVNAAEVKYHSIGLPILSAVTFDTLRDCSVARAGQSHRGHQLDAFRFHVAPSRFARHRIWTQLRFVIHPISGLNLLFGFRRYSIDSVSDRPQPIHHPDLGDLCRPCYLEVVINLVDLAVVTSHKIRTQLRIRLLLAVRFYFYESVMKTLLRLCTLP
jgi:hypothetical protein